MTPIGEHEVVVTPDFNVAKAFIEALGADHLSTAFQNSLWLEGCIKMLAQPRGITPLFCMVRNPEGRALLLLPLCLRKKRSRRIIEGVDLGVSDYIAPVMASCFVPTPSEWTQLWQRIVAALPRHDVLRLTKVPPSVGNRPNPLTWVSDCRVLELQAHGVAISTPWETCALRIFSKSRREKFRKSWRKLAEFGELHFRCVTDPTEMTGLFEQLVAQRLHRFASLQRNDPLRDPNRLNFYRSLVANGAHAGFVRLLLIEIDGRPVAMQFGVCHGNAFHLLIPTFFDGPWAHLGPGMLLSARTMQWAAENGFTYFDFTIGNESYKARLGAVAHDLHEIVVAGSWRGMPTLAAVGLKAWIKRRPLLLSIVRKCSRWSISPSRWHPRD